MKYTERICEDYPMSLFSAYIFPFLNLVKFLTSSQRRSDQKSLITDLLSLKITEFQQTKRAHNKNNR